MKRVKPKGFGKNYFSLASIQAYSSEVKMLSNNFTIESNFLPIYKISNDRDIDEPIDTTYLEVLILETLVEPKKEDSYLYNDLSPPWKLNNQ